MPVRRGIAHFGPAILMVGVWIAAPAARAEANGDAVSALKQLSIEELSNTEITSVSKTAEPLSDAAAAIFVITREDILNSGARSLPEILRLAPNLQVAQVTASSFAITARGFNGTAASKLLVLIDGRSVYTPYHSGVSWDAQEVLPEDIERIEVISGPGATLWGANAVNGVINIITRSSADTHGGSAQAGGGNLEQRGSVQYGARLGAASSFRAYVDSFHADNDLTATGGNADDGWNKTQGGFRFDWTPAGDLVTLQGDSYRGWEHKAGPPDESISGDNLLARWNHALDGGAALQVQAYYDYTDFSRTGLESDDLSTYDIDVQHSFAWGERQGIVWGGGVRTEEDDFPTTLLSTQPLQFSPQRRTLNYTNIFLQDGISLSQSVKLIVGAKYEHDAYTGGEPLPNARMSWKISDGSLLWASASKAVRAPSRLDRDLYEIIGPLVVIKGGNFQDEKLTAYEVGYRSQPTVNSSLSISTFYNVYTDLRSVEYSPGGILPAMFANLMAGNTYGIEAWGNYQVSDWWRLGAGANWLHEDLHFQPGSSGFGGTQLAGDDPSYQLSLRSTMNLSSRWTLDVDLRHISALPNPVSPSYTELGAHISWAISSSVSIALTGSNLIHAQHLEFGTTAAPLQLGSTGVEVGRSVFVDVRAKF
ncbi:MAG TPA: TonB-dependent receptor [Steroidobacteraceae bacterium]